MTGVERQQLESVLAQLSRLTLRVERQEGDLTRLHEAYRKQGEELARIKAENLALRKENETLKAENKARARFSYGPSLRAVALELSTSAGGSPSESRRKWSPASWGVDLSHGVISQWVNTAAHHLRKEGFETDLVEAAKASPVTHADETPISLAGATRYVHAQVTKEHTYLCPGDRSRDAVRSGRILGGGEDVLVSDDYTAYKHLLGPAGLRQMCWAHLLRDLTWFDKAYTPTEKAGGTLEHPHPGLTLMIVEVQELIHQTKQGKPSTPAEFRRLLQGALHRARAPRGGPGPVDAPHPPP